MAVSWGQGAGSRELGAKSTGQGAKINLRISPPLPAHSFQPPALRS